MSPVTPKPAAEFSTLAMTKSSWRCSTSAGTARRTISRPGLPKMSPMNRIRKSVDPDRDTNLGPAPLGDARQDDAKLAGGERSGGGAGVIRGGHAHRAGEAAERPLGEMEGRIAMVAASGRLPSRDDEHVARERHLDVVGGDARNVHHDFQGGLGFDDIDRRRALG